MKHVTESAPQGTLERLRAARSRFAPARYDCDACLDTGLLYAHRTPYGRPALGVIPCTECQSGAARHLDGRTCLWARGSKPCPLCGALEGGQAPAGWQPQAPAGWIPYPELPGWTGEP